MKKQISNISVQQTSKVIALIYFVVSAIICIPWGIIGYFATGDTTLLLLFLFPIFYLILGYIFMLIFSSVYNVLASSFGGIEFTLQDVEEKP